MHRNPFLLIRFIFLSLMIFLNLLDLIFASWNASAAVNAGLSVPGASIFLIFAAVASIFLLVLGLLELVATNFPGSSVIFESSWSAVLSIAHIAAAIGTTINTASTIRQTTDLSATVSSLLLLVTSWLGGLAMLAYFFVLFVSAWTHTQFEEELWNQPVSQVKWFGYANSRLKSSDVSGPRQAPGLEDDSWTRYLDGIESTGIRKARNPLPDEEKAPWAPTNVRRGRDSPFRPPTKSSRCSDASSESSFSACSLESGPLPPLPLNIQPKSGAGSRFIERFRESQRISRPAVAPVLDFMDDHDKPVPQTRRSQWISADAFKSVFSH